MDLSLVIPVYNSDELLDKLVNNIIDSLNSNTSIKTYEILLIDDKSLDESWKKIKSLSNKFDVIKGIKLRDNFGQHNAIMCGLNECSGKYIITMDDDLQHHPTSIQKLLQELDKGNDVCYTKYLNRQHALWKKFVSWLNNIVSSYLLNKPFNIYMSSYRAFVKSVANEIIKYKGSRIYIDGLILKATNKISIIPVQHYKREKGESNYTFIKLISLWSDMATTFPYKPLRPATLVRIIIFTNILLFRKFLSIFKTQKNEQFIIEEKTYSNINNV